MFFNELLSKITFDKETRPIMKVGLVRKGPTETNGMCGVHKNVTVRPVSLYTDPLRQVSDSVLPVLTIASTLATD